jgi:hypothetical protein
LLRQEQTVKAIQQQALSENSIKDLMQSTIANFTNTILQKQEELITTILENTLGNTDHSLNDTVNNNSSIENNYTNEENSWIITRKTLLILAIIAVAIAIILFTTTVCVLFYSLTEFLWLKAQTYKNKRKSEGRLYTYDIIREPTKKIPPPVAPKNRKPDSLPEIPTELELQEIKILAESDWNNSEHVQTDEFSG